MIKLRFFAALREVLGCDSETLTVTTPLTVAELRAQLATKNDRWAAALAPEATVLAAVNHELAQPNTLVQDGDEVAFFPPVTGG